MKILFIADKESPYLWDHYQPGRLDGIDLIISCGDLKAEYLSFLATMAGVPVLYVHGNHDKTYELYPPEGCECIDGKIVNIGGIKILGLGGCPVYSGGVHQYTELQMNRRILRLSLKLWWQGGVDIVVTHAPPKGFGDGADYAHRGFEALVPFMDWAEPSYLVHGHVHMNYGTDIPRQIIRGKTTIVNAYERYVLEVEGRL